MMNPTVPPDDHQQAVLNMSKMGMNGKGPMRISGSKQPFLAGSLPRAAKPIGDHASRKPRKQQDYVNRDRRLGETARPCPRT